jgi:uncharacterized protein (TIGR02145 family)
MKNLTRLLMMIAIAAIGCKKDNKQSVAVVTTTIPSSITASSATTGGTIVNNGGSAITKSGVCWALHATPTLSDSITTDGTSSGSFTTTLSNLSANTVYYVRAYAINGTGTGYGSVDSFTTSVGLATVVTRTISNIVALSAVGGATVTNDGGATVTARGICWSTSAHPTINNFKTADGSGPGAFTDTLTDLASQTVYYVRGYATNSFGTAYGNELTFTAASANTVVDIDGNVYPAVTLGTQTWMAANLRTTHYQNGDAIPYGNGSYDWVNNTGGAYSFPNGDSTNNAKYGKLYDAFVVNDTRNACPVGWHVATDQDWETLEFFEGMSAADTGTTNNRGTIAPKLVAGGISGLNLLYSGELFPGDSTHYDFGVQAYYLSGTAVYNNTNQYLGNYYRHFDSTNPLPIDRNYGEWVMSVRCVKN